MRRLFALLALLPGLALAQSAARGGRQTIGLPTCTAGQALTADGAHLFCGSVTGIIGTLAEANGGTGTGALTCSAGQALTSDGTSFSCTTISSAFAAGATRRVAVAQVQDSTATSFSMFGLPTLILGGNNTTTVDLSNSAAHAMLNFSVPGTLGNKAGWLAVNVTRAAYLPRLDIGLYAGPTTTTGGGTLDFVVGLTNDAIPMSNLGGTGAVCGTATGGGASTGRGSFICYENATGLAPGNGTKWVYCVAGNDGFTRCTDSGITVATGFHTFVIDMSVAGSTTYQIDGNAPVTRDSSAVPTTTQLSAVFTLVNFNTSAGYNASTPGFQLTQTF